MRKTSKYLGGFRILFLVLLLELRLQKPFVLPIFYQLQLGVQESSSDDDAMVELSAGVQVQQRFVDHAFDATESVVGER